MLALAAIAALVAAASLTSFAESYRGLSEWAARHGLRGLWAYAWPLQVDVFIAVGELALFVGLVDRWTHRNRAGAWTVTLAGLAVSVAGNVGHVAGHALTSRATAAVPPLAAAAALAVGLGVLKRAAATSTVRCTICGRAHSRDSCQVMWSAGTWQCAPELECAPAVPGDVPASAPVPEPVPAESNGHEPAAHVFAAALERGEVPSIRRIRERMHCGQPRAKEIQGRLEALTPAGRPTAQLRNEMRTGGAS
jgi:hypothetical protein